MGARVIEAVDRSMGGVLGLGGDAAETLRSVSGGEDDAESGWTRSDMHCIHEAFERLETGCMK